MNVIDLLPKHYQEKVSHFVMNRRFPLDLEPELPIEVVCDEPRIRQLWAHVERTWEQLGRDEPYWSVLSGDSFRTSSFTKYETRFWESGRFDSARLPAWMKRNGIEPQPDWTCLEYGCGTGRITRWLCRQFRSVTACDISSAHLALARKATSDLAARVQFLQISDLEAIHRLPAADVLFSIMVLQHNPPPVIAYILDRLLGNLRPGAIAFFQVPTFRLGYTFDVNQYLSKGHDEMEMHILPQRHVFEIARRRQCEIIEVQPDNWAWSLEFVSTTFLLRKAGG